MVQLVEYQLAQHDSGRTLPQASTHIVAIFHLRHLAPAGTCRQRALPALHTVLELLAVPHGSTRMLPLIRPAAPVPAGAPGGRAPHGSVLSPPSQWRMEWTKVMQPAPLEGEAGVSWTAQRWATCPLLHSALKFISTCWSHGACR